MYTNIFVSIYIYVCVYCIYTHVCIDTETWPLYVHQISLPCLFVSSYRFLDLKAKYSYQVSLMIYVRKEHLASQIWGSGKGNQFAEKLIQDFR